MKIRMKLWLEANGKVLFGHGRLELLQAIAETGSLAGAAKKLDMSYRAAWGRLKASEERLGLALLEPGGKGRRNSELTPQARELLHWFEELETQAQTFLRQAELSRPAFIQDAQE
jgi:molybdate transport system regulatory protein